MQEKIESIKATELWVILKQKENTVISSKNTVITSKFFSKHYSFKLALAVNVSGQ